MLDNVVRLSLRLEIFLSFYYFTLHTMVMHRQQPCNVKIP
jgi:hypothetical protein